MHLLTSTSFPSFRYIILITFFRNECVFITLFALNSLRHAIKFIRIKSVFYYHISENVFQQLDPYLLFFFLFTLRDAFFTLCHYSLKVHFVYNIALKFIPILFQNVVNSIKDKTLEAWLEDTEGISAFRQNKWFVLSLSESSNINFISITDHQGCIIVTRTVVWR